MVDVSFSRQGCMPECTPAALHAAPLRRLPRSRPRIAIALAGLLAGLGVASCASTSTTTAPASESPSYFDRFKGKPTTTLMLIESNPAGAQAKTSFGKACTTPCTMLIGESSDFTVTFTLAGYVSQTLPVHARMDSGGWTTAPSPVFDPPKLFPTLEKEAPVAPVARKPGKPHV
jgi:hypothetical protein